MIDFIAQHAGMIGLLFFFVFFSVATLWVFRPGAKKIYTQHANIPFEENKE